MSTEKIKRENLASLSFGELFFKGLEKEGLRSTRDFHISHKPHQHDLGSKLTHPYITTDYSEALLEFITPVFNSSSKALNFLKDLHHFSYNVLKKENEFLWNSSMPTILNGDSDVLIADYGKSNVGKLKSLYRMGLGYRYGRTMQAIAGIHYNLSFNDDWFLMAKPKSASESEFRSQEYFHLIRNFRRNSWLLMYLFGASPVVDESFLTGKKHDLKKLFKNTWGSEFATSLRMGGLGYTSSAQDSISICYNKISTYLKSLEKARRTSYAPYEKIGFKVDGEFRQLNTNLLQIDNEFYSNIRPKRVAKSGQSALQALEEGGVQYLEVRLLDINPYLPVGISEVEMDFIDLFLLYCYLKPSFDISNTECEAIDLNLKKVVTQGRNEKIVHETVNGEVSTRKRASFVLSDMLQTFKDFSSFSEIEKIISKQTEKIENSSLLPSQKIMDDLQKNDLSYVELMGKLSLEHSEKLLLEKMSGISENELVELGVKSHQDQLEIEKSETINFEDFLTQYFEDIKLKTIEI